jgi:hypothetical protein
MNGTASRSSWSLRSAVAGLLAGVLLGPAVGALAEQTYTWGERYRQIPARYLKVIDDTEMAFTRRDVEGSVVPGY